MEEERRNNLEEKLTAKEIEIGDLRENVGYLRGVDERKQLELDQKNEAIRQLKDTLVDQTRELQSTQWAYFIIKWMIPVVFVAAGIIMYHILKIYPPPGISKKQKSRIPDRVLGIGKFAWYTTSNIFVKGLGSLPWIGEYFVPRLGH